MWIGDRYEYKARTLKKIAWQYAGIYDELIVSWSNLVESEQARIDYKVDFDYALDAIGKGHWTGELVGEFEDYRWFGRLQRIVIADIYGIEDRELGGLGFYDIPQLRGRAYKWMANYLNGLPYGAKFIREFQNRVYN